MKNNFKHVFSIFFPPEGNFDVDAGDGGGGGVGDQIITTNYKQLQIIKNKYFVRNCITLLGHFSNNFNKSQRQTLKYVSIYRKTPNLITALKIAICYTNHTKRTKIHSTKPKSSKIIEKNVLLFI